MVDAVDLETRASATGRQRSVSTGMVVLIALACGVSVASLYYPQPLVNSFVKEFHTSSGTAGLATTGSQVGYAIGLAFLVPLGDLFRRRRLVPAVMALCIVALAASALAPNVGTLITLAVAVGLTTTVVQMLVPFAASLASDRDRGRVVGTVMSGLLLGILLSRTLSGLVAGASNWRVVYWVGAGLVGLLAIVLARALPPEAERPKLSYGHLLVSTVGLVRSEPVLRRRMLMGALAFGCFSVLWTTVAFLLGGSPYHYGDGVIGLFGLFGAAGTLCASFAGRMVDRGHARILTGVFAVLLVASFGLLLLGRHTLAWLIVGIIVLDMGVQGLHITNQSLVYRLAPGSHSRVNAAYMTVYFIGGSIGSALSDVCYQAWGWTAVCLLGAGIGAAAVLCWLFDLARPASGG